MKARAAVLEAGNWTPLPIGTWALVAATLPTPWKPEVIHADLVWWSDRASPQRPSHAVLAARWGVSKSTARRLVVAFDGSDGVNFREPVVNRSWSDGEPVAQGSRPTSDAKRTGREPVVNRSWSDGEPVHHENDANPMVFEGSQKQKTEAEDREEQEDRTHVPQADPAAPSALGPTDPTCDEPDWDALFEGVPLTYDDEATDDEATEAGPVDVPSGAADVADGPAAVDGGALAPVADAVPGALGGGAGGDGAARPVVTDDGCLPLASVTQAPPATRATDVDALWEAWRGYGTVRGRPNPKRRRLLERALEAHGLPAMLDLLAAAHGGADRYWRFLQGATPESDTTYLSPETLLNGRLDERVERAAAWVEAGRPTHDVAETRTEARTQAVTRPAKERALAAWDRVAEFSGLTLDQARQAMARWPEENQRAMLAGLEAVGGLSTLGRLDPFARGRRRGDFVRGVVEALGGKLTEAELREVG